MKKQITIIGFLILSHALSAKTRSISLDLPTMNCRMCPVTVKKALSQLEGVSAVDVNFEKKIADVTFDDDKTNVSELIEATTNAGYPATIKR